MFSFSAHFQITKIYIRNTLESTLESALHLLENLKNKYILVNIDI